MLRLVYRCGMCLEHIAAVNPSWVKQFSMDINQEVPNKETTKGPGLDYFMRTHAGVNPKVRKFILE